MMMRPARAPRAVEKERTPHVHVTDYLRLAKVGKTIDGGVSLTVVISGFVYVRLWEREFNVSSLFDSNFPTEFIN